MHELRLWSRHVLLLFALTAGVARSARPADEEVEQHHGQSLKLSGSSALLERGSVQGEAHVASRRSGFSSLQARGPKDGEEPEKKPKEKKPDHGEHGREHKEEGGAHKVEGDADAEASEKDESAEDVDGRDASTEDEHEGHEEDNPTSGHSTESKFPTMQTQKFKKLNSDIDAFISDGGELDEGLKDADELAQDVKKTGIEWKKSHEEWRRLFQRLRDEEQRQQQEIDSGTRENWKRRASPGREHQKKIEAAIRKMEQEKAKAQEGDEDGEESEGEEEGAEGSDGGDAADEDSEKEEGDDKKEEGGNDKK
eukprot:gb/GFBE01005435.1/.p1 GENE.gb/GFBE01005435.1/~~gb/GFBE01005435.1/.p1  ORF type:complete len:310 (+),score=105.12 gb/GFBE01005435.1/:1-930(+)